MKYTIKPDAPGHPDTSFKVFNENGIKVATLTKRQTLAIAFLKPSDIVAALQEDEKHK